MQDRPRRATRGAAGTYDPAMPIDLRPTPAADDTRPVDPRAVVEAFLAALAQLDIDRAAAHLADDAVYVNVGLPAVRGRAKIAKALGSIDRPDLGFEVYLHAIASDGPVVLTERTDAVIVGKVRAQFWVAGRFDVHDGEITLWRDAFDYLDVTRAVLRALLGAVVPSLRPAPPRGDGPPGR